MMFLGVHFDTSSSSLIAEIATAVKVFAYGVESYVSEPENIRYPLGTRLSCSGAGAGEARWSTGERFYRHLRNVSVEGEAGRPSIEFTPDGELKAAELKIMNLRPALGEQVTFTLFSPLVHLLTARVYLCRKNVFVANTIQFLCSKT